MANLDAPFGFRPCRHLYGGIIRASDRYRIASAYGTDIFEGDMVTVDGSGNIVIGSATGGFIGAFAGVEYVASDGSIVFKNRWVASTVLQTGSVAKALVYDDPAITYEVQATGDIARADIGLLIDIDVTGSGSTVTGRSAQGVGAHAGSEANFRILNIIEKPRRNAAGNQAMTAAGQDAIVEVQIHEPLLVAVSGSEI